MSGTPQVRPVEPVRNEESRHCAIQGRLLVRRMELRGTFQYLSRPENARADGKNTSFPLSDLNCGDHRADLERRVSHLENMLLGQGLPPPHHQRKASTATTVNGASPVATERGGGGSGETVRAKSEDNLSETEEAAMTLEDIGELSRAKRQSND